MTTGYSIYNKEAKKRTRQNPLEELYPNLPSEKYDVIYADPPWDYGGKMQYDKSSVSKDKIDLNKKNIHQLCIFYISYIKNIGT